MSNLLGLIKQAAIDAVEATKPVKIRYGKVIKVDPITIRLNEKVTISGGFLCVLESYAQKCKLGDVVVLLSVQGGQQYVVLDRKVNT